MMELNISSNYLAEDSNENPDMSGVVAIADAIPDMGAMTSLNLADNNIGQLVMSDGWQFDEDADEYWKKVEGEEFVEKQLPAGEQLAIESPVGAIAIANAIKDMRALTSLHVRRNSIPKKEMREIMAIAMRMDSMQFLCEVPFKDKTLTELDVSEEDLGMEGALVIAEYLDGNGAILSVNLLKNKIGVDQAKALASILKEHPTLKSLCGNSGEETELDMSGKGMEAEDAIMLAPEIVDNGALTTVIMHTFPLPIEDIKTKAELDLSGKGLIDLDAIVLAALLPLNVSR
jgi:hypothetical protein